MSCRRESFNRAVKRIHSHYNVEEVTPMSVPLMPSTPIRSVYVLTSPPNIKLAHREAKRRPAEV